MRQTLKVLIIDDDEEFRELLSLILQRKGYKVESAESGEKGIDMIRKQNYDIVLTDMRMSGLSGIGVLKAIQELHPTDYLRPDCIMITGYGSIDNAVEAIRNGAFSYFIKSRDPEELLFEIEKIKKMRLLHRENVALKTEHASSGYMLKSLSPKFLKVLHAAHKVAQTEVNVLILGESGVGKEVLARYIHQSSQRSEGIFMPVNCYAFSETMIEAELYGHEKGAFTGANELRIGRFEAADNGTLFLDEIGEMPLSSQIKLLRNIENKEIERIGSNKTIRTDFRLICATNKDLKNAIEARTFREDLYYRINTIVLVIPPLRERKEDLPLMIQHFLEVINKDMKTRITGLDDEVMQVLIQYDYPGNVRELKNVIERLLVFSEGPIITMDDLLAHPVIPIGSSPIMSSDTMPEDQSLKAVRNKVEREHIEAVYRQMHGNIELTAKILDISPRQVYNKLNAFKNN